MVSPKLVAQVVRTERETPVLYIKKNRNLRGGSLGCASTILAYVARLLVAVAFLTAFVPSFALAQDAADAQASETGTDVASSDGQAGSIDTANGTTATATATANGALGRAIATASAESGVVPGPCEGGVNANCGEIVVEGVTYACNHDGTTPADDLAERLQRQFAHFRRVFRRELAAIHRELDGLHGEMAQEQAFDQRFYGWSPTSTYDQRLRIAQETGRYLREVVPVLLTENEIADDEDRAEFEAAQRARAEFERRTNDRMTEFERRLTTEHDERVAADNATNARIDEAGRYAITATLFGGALHIGGPSPAPTATTAVAGLSIGSRPWEPPITVVGRFAFTLGETGGDNDRGVYGFVGDLLGGYEWSTGRILAGATGMYLNSTKWRETTLLMAAGPIVRLELDPHRSVSVGASLSGLFGNFIDPTTGIGDDASRWCASLDVAIRFGRWGRPRH